MLVQRLVAGGGGLLLAVSWLTASENKQLETPKSAARAWWLFVYLVNIDYKYVFIDMKYKTFDLITLVCSYLPWATLSPVKRRTLLGLTEERVVVFTAPQLFTGVKVCVLQEHTNILRTYHSKRLNNVPERKSVWAIINSHYQHCQKKTDRTE